VLSRPGLPACPDSGERGRLAGPQIHILKKLHAFEPVEAPALKLAMNIEYEIQVQIDIARGK
jgi:hypothetical protein